MYKCWSCGTEHEDTAADAAYKRGYDAAVLDLAPNLQIAYEQGYNEAKRKYSEYLNADDEGSYAAGYRYGYDDGYSAGCYFTKQSLLTIVQAEQFDAMMEALGE